MSTYTASFTVHTSQACIHVQEIVRGVFGEF